MQVRKYAKKHKKHNWRGFTRLSLPYLSFAYFIWSIMLFSFKNVNGVNVMHFKYMYNTNSAEDSFDMNWIF